MARSPRGRASKKKQVNWEWSPEEDTALLAACGELGGQWSEIAKIISRNKDDCAIRWSLIMPPDWKSFHTLEWPDDDILRLIQAVRSTQFDIEKKSFIPSRSCDWAVVAAILNTSEWRWDAADCEATWIQLQSFSPFRLGSFSELEDVIIAERVLGWGCDQHGLWSWLGNVLKRDHTALRMRWKSIGKQFSGLQSVHKEVVSEPHLHGNALLFPNSDGDEDTEVQYSLWSQQNTPSFTSPTNLSTSLLGFTPTSVPSPTSYDPSSDTEQQNTDAVRKTPKRLHPANASAASAHSPAAQQVDQSCLSSYSDHESPEVRRVRQRTTQGLIDLTNTEEEEVERQLLEYTLQESQRLEVQCDTTGNPHVNVPSPVLPTTVRPPSLYLRTSPDSDPDRMQAEAALVRATRSLSQDLSTHRTDDEEELDRVLAVSLAEQDELILPPEVFALPTAPAATEHHSTSIRDVPSVVPSAPLRVVPSGVHSRELAVDVSALTEEEAFELAVQRSLSGSSGGTSSGTSSGSGGNSSGSRSSGSGSSSYFSPLHTPNTIPASTYQNVTTTSHHGPPGTSTGASTRDTTLPTPEEVLSFEVGEVDVEELMLEQQMLEEAIALSMTQQHQETEEPEDVQDQPHVEHREQAVCVSVEGSGAGGAVSGEKGDNRGEETNSSHQKDPPRSLFGGVGSGSAVVSTGGGWFCRVGSGLGSGVGSDMGSGEGHSHVGSSHIFGSSDVTPHTTTLTTSRTAQNISWSHPSVNEVVPSQLTGLNTVEQRVRAIYTLHNPAKLPSVSELMRKYHGREDVLLDKLRNKYGTTSAQERSRAGGSSSRGSSASGTRDVNNVGSSSGAVFGISYQLGNNKK